MSPKISIENAVEKISNASWYHSFEVIPGVITPGKYFVDANAVFKERYSLSNNLKGMKALDIGALDGPYTFELERRGAEVIAIDIQNPNHTGFNTAKNIRESKAQYIQGNVYELSRLVDGKFDIITFFGVWYHLKHPLIAFNEISKVLSTDGLLLLEGECLRNYAELPGMGKDNLERSLVRGVEYLEYFSETVKTSMRKHQKLRKFISHPLVRTVRERLYELRDKNPEKSLVRAMANSNIPITLFYSGEFKGDEYNWFIPNLACVREWLHASGFELINFGFYGSHPDQRMFGTAKKNPNYEIIVDNPVY